MSGTYSELLDHLRGTAALGQVSSLLSWDQEAMMPPAGGPARAEQMAELEKMLHARRTDPRLGAWLEAIDADRLDPAGRANLREARRMHQRAVRVPAELASEIARVTSLAHREWVNARTSSDYAGFAPTLGRVVELQRQYAACIAEEGQSPYDALVSIYEPGATTASLAALFQRLRGPLSALSQRIADRPAPPPLTGHFPAAAQHAVATEAAKLFGYDMSAGRIDMVVHPFCSGTRGDVRITTRTDEADPLDCIYSTIHETGHALYEQGLDPALEGQPAGNSVSMGVHESQSRLCENQIGRGRAFCEWLYPRLRDAFGEIGADSPAALYRAVNRVERGFIRTEADEVHYNLHVMLRFDLERGLIMDDLQVGDLEAAWNARFAQDFGVPVPSATEGVLQDVHWSAGLFGYFPTYTLGNLYAAELYRAMNAALPDLDTLIAAGNLAPAREWLRREVHAAGSLFDPAALIERATGAPPTETALLDYLEKKFGALYDF